MVDYSRIDWTIYYPPPSHTYTEFRNRWKIWLSVNRTTVKKEPINKVSYKLHPYVPHSILVLLIQFMLTDVVSTALWRAAKKNSSTESRVAYRLKEQKYLQFKQNTLLIEDFKYDPLLCLFVQIK